jgi:hypothetical protein
VSVWILVVCFFGVAFLQTANAVTMSFVERDGNFRGFDPASIGMVLAVGGVIPLSAPVAATLLEKKLSPIWMVIIDMLLHGALSLAVFNSTMLGLFFVSYALVPTMVSFTHTFAFGFLAKFDLRGRMNALMPAMMMTGSAVGPVLGGTVAKYAGFA